jgi:hypothetical protein
MREVQHPKLGGRTALSLRLNQSSVLPPIGGAAQLPERSALGGAVGRRPARRIQAARKFSRGLGPPNGPSAHRLIMSAPPGS